jgi:hypothetical protein
MRILPLLFLFFVQGFDVITRELKNGGYGIEEYWIGVPKVLFDFC